MNGATLSLLGKRSRGPGEEWAAFGPANMALDGIGRQKTNAPLRGPEEIYLTRPGFTPGPEFRFTTDTGILGGVTQTLPERRTQEPEGRDGAPGTPDTTLGSMRGRIAQAPLRGAEDIYFPTTPCAQAPTFLIRPNAGTLGGIT